jgi:hypothetical protein
VVVEIYALFIDAHITSFQIGIEMFIPAIGKIWIAS